MERFDDVLAQWLDAEVHGDTTTLAALLDEHFRGDGPDGLVLTKQQWLDRHRTGDLRHDALRWPHTHVRVYGGVGVAMGIQAQTGRYRGCDCSGQFWVTVVAVCWADPDRWSIVNVQLRELSDPPPPLQESATDGERIHQMDDVPSGIQCDLASDACPS